MSIRIKTIINIFQLDAFLLSKSVKLPLGRWNIDNYNQTLLKIKYANEDNCGVCCKNDKYTKYENEDENKYIYMMGYESIPN